METVRVIYHHEADGWWAESPDVEGWSAAGDTYAEVVKLAEEGIQFALKHQPSWSTTFRPASAFLPDPSSNAQTLVIGSSTYCV
jgi:predicted RNase H-like HicB family nuclease